MDTSGLQVGLIKLPGRAKRFITTFTDAAVVSSALAGTLLLVHQQNPGAISERWPYLRGTVRASIRPSSGLSVREWSSRYCEVSPWWFLCRRRPVYGWVWIERPLFFPEWVRRVERDKGLLGGITSTDRERLKALERESCELKRVKNRLGLTHSHF